MKNRQGSYKKVLMAESFLAPHRHTLIKGLHALQKKELSDFEFCSLYILLFLRVRHSKNWLQKKRSFVSRPDEKKILSAIPEEFELSSWEKQKLEGASFLDLFEAFNLKGIPEATGITMINWTKGNWKIALLFHIPSPRELLVMQVKNTRCITLTTKEDEIDQLVLSSRDPLSFVLHDLHHAYQFFINEECQKGQLGFYSLVEKIYDQPLLKQSLKIDDQFKSDFHYVVSDMNAYVIHLFKCFKSAFVRLDNKHSTLLFAQLLEWWQMPAEVSSAALKLNTPEFNENDEVSLRRFFESSQEVLV